MVESYRFCSKLKEVKAKGNKMLFVKNAVEVFVCITLVILQNRSFCKRLGHSANKPKLKSLTYNCNGWQHITATIGLTEVSFEVKCKLMKAFFCVQSEYSFLVASSTTLNFESTIFIHISCFH